MAAHLIVQPMEEQHKMEIQFQEAVQVSIPNQQPHLQPLNKQSLGFCWLSAETLEMLTLERLRETLAQGMDIETSDQVRFVAGKSRPLGTSTQNENWRCPTTTNTTQNTKKYIREKIRENNRGKTK